MHTTHVLVSLIGVLGLVAFTYLSEVMAKVPLDAHSVAAVWIVGLPLFGYFVSKISVNAQGMNEVTSSATNAAQK
jgi:hypothetical protein